MRRGGRKTTSKHSSRDVGDNRKSGRATRANQRRMLKDSWMIGGVKETMSGCEHALRFGKSIIHGWGVFTDEEIIAGDLIVEYRGVLIGNAVADRREIEYERAKIGSDYMFRMDSGTVCDATHQGCVARFVNASCTPNCYTQIITVNGVKRIVIYAKKDIERGEELSYDYKFEAEFDESKRIPCNCGTSHCRGFMNWDQRYVAIKPRDTKKVGKG
jgi:histone-lysine N-methyltransferase SETD1